jgi:hypothetical protein
VNLGTTGLEAAFLEIMNGHLPVSETAARRVRKNKGQTGSVKSRKGQARAKSAAKRANDTPHLAAAGSLTRTKALLLAALRVWELKHRIGDS